MTSLLVLLLSPLLCQGASVYEQDQWKVVHSGEAPSQPIRSSQPEAPTHPTHQPVVNTGSQPSCPEGGSSDSSCALLRSTMDLLKAASATAECSACDCDKAEAEKTCLSYIASVFHVCRDTSSVQAACVRQELTSGYPAGLAPCSSDAALCTAIAEFAKITASTLALTCTDTKTIGDGLDVGITGEREGRFLGSLGHIITLVAAALVSAGTNPLDTVAHKAPISCTAVSPPALKLPCIFPFHQGADGDQESVAGVQVPVVYNGCATADIVQTTFTSTSAAATTFTITGQPAAVATVGLNDAPRWCATAVDAAAATGGNARGSSIRGNAVPADRMVRWRYCGACIVV